jgi:ubiquinone/menaquinone biosynthesis C-methylase UbiE
MTDVVGETRQTYDRIAAAYAERKQPYTPLMHHFEALAELLPRGSTVADIGCGPGEEVRLLREYGFTAFGFDFSAGQLRAAGIDGLAQADMRNLPIRTASLDAVWCQAALLHIPRTDVPTVLAEFARVVREGGRLHLMVAEGDDERWEQASNYGSELQRWFTYHREPELTRRLAEVGFVVQQAERRRSNRDWLSLSAVRAPDRPRAEVRS